MQVRGCAAQDDLAGDVTVHPRGFTLLSYERIFRYKLVLSGFLNSLFYVTAGTSLNLALTVFLAYPLSRKDLRGLAVIGIFVLIPLFFRGGIVPTFLVVNSLGLVNTRWAVILPAGLSIWNTIVARTYFANLPQEFTEASEIDGCSDLRFQHGDLADAQVRAYRRCQRADDDPLSVHPETLRQGCHDRLHQGVAE